MARYMLGLVVTFALVGCADDGGGAGDSDTGEDGSFVILSSPTKLAPIAPPPGASFATGEGSPSMFEVKMFAAYVSASPDCSDPILLEDFGAAKTFDVVQSPTLFTGNLPEGSYPCLVIKLTDILSFQPDDAAVAAHAACEADTIYTSDTYRDGGEDDGLWETLDGMNIDATGTSDQPGEDTTFTFFSTDVDAIRATNGDIPHEFQKLPLDNAMEVPGSATMYLDFTDGLGEEGGECSIVDGSIGFQ